MEQHDFLQGSQEWHQHRASHFNASDAPAMLGISQYKTRNQLLHEMVTGITPYINAATQRRFDDGHRFEALARPMAEQIIGKKLYPVIGSEGKLSASFDGLTADDTVCWEHKSANAALLESLRNMTIPEQYLPQMEQQLMLSGAERCLFSATKWEGNVLIEEAHCWYISDPVLRERILQGWTQFAIDLEHVEIAEKPKAEKPKAEAILNLPALAVQATGMVTYSNLPEFKAAAENYIASINTDLQTDQQFADAEAVVKFCKATEETLEVTKKAILAQTATIDEVIRTVDHIQAQLRDKRLMLDKLVKSEKESRKASIVQAARMQFNDFVLELEAETKPIRLTMAMPVFADAIKGLKKLSAMQEAVDTELRNAKFDAEQVAKDIRAKLAWCKENAAGMSFLFPDLQQIISKPMDDFTLTITSRIKEHKEAEECKVAEIRAKAEADAAAKLEAERAAMQAEEEAKARAKVEVEAQVNAVAQPAQAVQALTGSQPQEAGMTAPNSNVVVIEHQDVISAFMASHNFAPKDVGRFRAVLVEFVKFEAQFGSKKVAA